MSLASSDRTKAYEGVRCVAVQTILMRAVYWLANEKIDASVPDDFPSTEQISLMPIQ